MLLESVLTLLCLTQADVVEEKPPEWSGRFVPVGGAEVEADVGEWSGALEFLEVADHGTMVDKGDVLARFDTEKIDEAIENAEIALRSAEIALKHAEWSGRLAVEKEEADLRNARVNLARAEKALEGWETVEVEFRRRDAERSAKRQQNGIDDQQDELSQLEAMYREDELTDETEELVLARARRSLAMSVDSLKLAEARRKYKEEYQDPIADARKKEAVDAAKLALKHLEAKTEMSRTSRADGLAKTARAHDKAKEALEELRASRDGFRVVAPRAGVVLHGAADAYRPGRAARHHEVGGATKGGATLFTVTSGDAMALAFDIPETDLGKLRQNMAVKVTPLFSPDTSMVGRLSWARFPTPTEGPKNSYAASIEFDDGVAGLVPGMRATVTPARSAKGSGKSGGAGR